MPCHSIRTTSVQLDKSNVNLMLAALTDLALGPRLHADGHTIWFGRQESIDCTTGAAQLGRYRTVNEIKKAYSAAVVKATAKKFGWQPATTNTNEAFVYNRR